jgi:glutathione peroxidase
MKSGHSILSAILLLACVLGHSQKATMKIPSGIYDFTVTDLAGKPFSFAQFRGQNKKILIVNTASKCGYTPQYAQLEELYEKYKDKLVIVGFPSNDYGGQEPGTNQQIAEFCHANYGVTFPMMSKVSTKKGPDMAPIYHFLTEKKLNGFLDSEIEWNFQKYLFDENGRMIAMFPSKVTPVDPQITRLLD